MNKPSDPFDATGQVCDICGEEAIVCMEFTDGWKWRCALHAEESIDLNGGF